jgi:hypothetical protein
MGAVDRAACYREFLSVSVEWSQPGQDDGRVSTDGAGLHVAIFRSSALERMAFANGRFGAVNEFSAAAVVRR